MKHEDDVSKAYTDIPEIEREDRFFIAIQMVCDWRPIGYIGSSFNSYIQKVYDQ